MWHYGKANVWGFPRKTKCMLFIILLFCFFGVVFLFCFSLFLQACNWPVGITGEYCIRISQSEHVILATNTSHIISTNKVKQAADASKELGNTIHLMTSMEGNICFFTRILMFLCQIGGEYWDSRESKTVSCGTSNWVLCYVAGV